MFLIIQSVSVVEQLCGLNGYIVFQMKQKCRHNAVEVSGAVQDVISGRGIFTVSAVSLPTENVLSLATDWLRDNSSCLTNRGRTI